MKAGRVTSLFCSLLSASLLMTLAAPANLTQRPAGISSSPARNAQLLQFTSSRKGYNAPLAWPVFSGIQAPVEVNFTHRDHAGDFVLGQLDSRFLSSIYPTLTWNTFLGAGNGSDYGNAIALDEDGNIYVLGASYATWGAPVRAHDPGPNRDAFIAKLDSSGALQWNTFLGGSGNDDGSGIAVDGNGNIYVAGSSNAAWDCPPGSCTVSAYNGGFDVFAAKLNSSDGAYQWNTFLGGSGDDYGSAIALDGDDNVYISGEGDTAWGAPVRAYTSGSDAFTARLDSSGALHWYTFLGGSGSDYGKGITLDGDGNLYVTGYSNESWGMPVRAYSSDFDAYAAKLDSSGALQWNTFLGGNDIEYGFGIALDGDGNVYVVGNSFDSWGSPVRSYTSSIYSPNDGFVARLDSGGALQWNTFLGEGGVDLATAIALDSQGIVQVVGFSNRFSWSCSPTPCTVRDFSGGYDAFAANLDSRGTLRWNTFLGGSGKDYGYGIALDGDGDVFVTGYSDAAWGCSPATCTVHPYSSGVYYDAFIAKLLHPLSTDADLSDLVLSTGSFSPLFDTATTTYTQSVANAVTFLTVTPTVADAWATVTVNGTAVASGNASSPIALAVGANPITTIVTAEDGLTIRTYTVTVTRTPSSNASLSNLVLSTGALMPGFASGTTAYTQSVSNTVTSVTVMPTLADATAAVTVNGAPVASGHASSPIALAVGANLITTIITAQHGTTTMTYIVTVSRLPSSNAFLSNLVLSTGALTPAFTSGTTSYTQSVGATVTSLIVMPTLADATATVTVNGIPVPSGNASGSIALVIGPNTIKVVVTAQDGITIQTYTITVTRSYQLFLPLARR